MTRLLICAALVAGLAACEPEGSPRGGEAPGSNQGDAKQGQGKTTAKQGQGKTEAVPGYGKLDPVKPYVPVEIEPENKEDEPPPPPLHADQEDVFFYQQGEEVYLSNLTIAARDPETGDLGYASIGSAPAIGTYIGAAEAGVGVVLVGGKVDVSWREKGIAMLRAGSAPGDIVGQLFGTDRTLPSLASGQLAVLDAKGESAFAWGAKILGRTGNDYVRSAENAVVMCANTKPGPVLEAMLTSFAETEGIPLPERLVVALQEGFDALEGGALQNVARPTSAALVVVRENGGYRANSDRLVDLRVDLSSEPLVRLRNCYRAWVKGYLAPRLRTLQMGISDMRSERYKQLNGWLQRIRRQVEFGAKQ